MTTDSLSSAKKILDEEMVPLEEVLKEAKRIGVPKFDERIANLPETIPLDDKDMEYFGYLKKLQTLHNALGLHLKAFAAEIETTQREFHKYLSKKHNADTRHFTFSEFSRCLIRNFGNESKIFNTRIVNADILPEIIEKAERLFKDILKNLSVVYNETERAKIK